ncbi:hypothetical protein NCCP1664_23360 [Zafaria cholistanensis]|uniref:Glycosyl transferase n=1 Tax=Zafaria cholistanensis TaxID=1682741 RepID=A0A5A7NV51_9MICC|nr:hypothetical protein NCCP1664_23360 [Zafaria cholistanensis]
MDGFVGVDAESADGSVALLRSGLPGGTPIAEAPARGFGASVQAAARLLPEPLQGVQDWIWLIHDDSAPAPDALQRLLAAVETAPSVTIAGCKQLDLDRPRRLIDVGLSISRWGERLTLIDVDELDQGQYDGRSDAFAVNSAGMLVRRDVWEDLGGFDPALPGLGDDLDLCWRNRMAGHRVVVVPGAHMFHAADAVHAVSGPAAARTAEVYLRLKHAPLWALPLLALGAVLGGLVRFVASLLAKDPGHAAGQLGASLRAVFSPFQLVRSRRAAAATRKVPRSLVRPLMVPRRDVWSHRRSLLESFHAEQVMGDGTGSVAEASNPSGDANDDFAALAGPQRTSAGVGAGVAVLAAAAVSLLGLRALVGAPALGGGSALPLSASPGGLWANAFGWWQSAGSGRFGHGDPFDAVLWILSLLGFGQANGALVAFALAAMPLSALLAWTALGAVTGSRAARLLGGLAWAVAPTLQVALASGRLGAVVAHVLLPVVVLGAIRAVGAARPRDRSESRAAFPSGPTPPTRPGVGGVPSWTAAAGASLALAAVTAGAPVLLPVAVVLTVLVALPLRRRAKALWWMPLPALALALPLGLSALGNPRALLADPGVPQAFAAAPLWQQALGFPVAFDPSAGVAGFALPGSAGAPWSLVAALLVGVPALVAAACALFLPGRAGRMARVLWFAGTLALAAGFGAQYVPTAVAGPTLTTAFTGPTVSVFVLAVLFGAALFHAAFHTDALNAAALDTAGRGPGKGRRAGAALLAGAVLLSTATTGALWLAPRLGTTAEPETVAARPATDFGASQELVPAAARTLPATAADRGHGTYAERVLVIAPGTDGGMAAVLMSGSGTTLDQLSQVAASGRLHGSLTAPEVKADDDADAALRRTVAALASGQGIDPRPELQQLGVSFVVLQETDSSSSLLAGQLDAVPGLAAVGSTDSGWLWRVDPASRLDEDPGVAAPTARVRIVDADGRTGALVPAETGTVPDPAGRSILVDAAPVGAGAAGRLVVLAERADAGWSATLDGRPLEPATSGWAQAFRLPAGGGTLTIRHTSPYALPVGVLQGAVFGLALLLVVPIPPRRRFAPRRVEEYRATSTTPSIAELDTGRPAGSGGASDRAPVEPSAVETSAAETALPEATPQGAPPGATVPDPAAGKQDRQPIAVPAALERRGAERRARSSRAALAGKAGPLDAGPLDAGSRPPVSLPVPSSGAGAPKPEPNGDEPMEAKQ